MKGFKTGCLVLALILCGCAAEPPKEDASVLETLKNAYEYQQTNMEGAYQTITINKDRTYTECRQIWNKEENTYEFFEYDGLDPAGNRFASLLVRHKDDGLSMQLVDTINGYVNEGYTWQAMEYTITDPFTQSLNDVLEFNEDHEVTGLDPDFRYERDGNTIRISLKDSKAYSDRLLEKHDTFVNDVIRINVTKADRTYTFDHYDHMVSYRSVRDESMLEVDGEYGYGSNEITVTKMSGFLSDDEQEQIEGLAKEVLEQ